MSCCGQNGTSGDADLITLGLDETEELVLSIIRCYCLAYSQPGRMCWEHALDKATVRFGADKGAAVSFATLGVLRAMRCARKTTFRFNNPFCSGCRNQVSNCERLLLSTLKFARHGDDASAHMQALILCEGFDVQPMLLALKQLNQLLTPFCETVGKEAMHSKKVVH